MLKYQIIDERDDNDERDDDDDDDNEQQEQKHVHNLVLSCGGRLFIRNKFNEYFNKIETKLDCRDPPPADNNDLITKLTFPFPNRSNQYYFKKHLLNTLRPLLEQSYWYYESITESESLAFLKRTKPGTFLLRDSANEDYLLAISFQTIFGTVSIRIDFKDNMFSLVPFDSDRNEEVPKFSNVISLIDFYRESKSLKLFGGKQANSFWIVFNANEGRKIPLSKSNPAFQLDSFTNQHNPNHNHNHKHNNNNNNNEDLEISLNLEITYPLYKQVPSLKHFCRLAINRSLAYQKVEFLEPDLLNYLNSYTFTI